MTNQDKITILITFFVGVFAGSYLYLTGFAPTYRLPETDTEALYEDLVIVGDEYGECTALKNCLSFQVLNDRSFRALVGSGEMVGIENGKIPPGLQTRLNKAITTEGLIEAMTELPSSACQAENTTGLHLRFHITFAGSTYNLNSCYSAMDYDAELWSALKELRLEIAKAVNEI